MSGAVKKEDGKFYISWEDYKNTSRSLRPIWKSDIAPEYIGKRTLLIYDEESRYAIEGFDLVIEGAPKQRIKK